MEDSPLFRTDLREMIRESLSPGEWTKRNAIIRHVCRRIEERGIPARQASVTTAVKKCLRQMKDAGEVHGGLDSGTFAHYRMAADYDPRIAAPPPAEPNTQPSDAPPAPLIAEQKIEPRVGSVDATRVVGQGRQTVYAYFYEADRVHSKTKGLTCWPCKVGLATRDAAGRLREQGAITSRSAPAVWALEIRTDDAVSLERAIHRVLKYAGRQTAGGGAEWFLTTPQMVEAIYLSLESIRCWPE